MATAKRASGLCMLDVALSAACAHADPTRDHSALILEGLPCPLKHLPYDLIELPKDNWLGFAYAGDRWKPIPCVLVPTKYRWTRMINRRLWSSRRELIGHVLRVLSQ
jgi:hypothetical protein